MSIHCNIILVEQQKIVYALLLNYPHELLYNILLDQMGEIE